MATFQYNLSLKRKLCILLALVSFALYANTLGNKYALDDVMVITGNRFVKDGFTGIPTLLSTHHLAGFGANNTFDYYRPLSLVMFAAEYQFFGPAPFCGHLLNLLLYAASVVLLFLFLIKLFGSERMSVAFIAAFVFAIHPVHTEVVANIKSRDELLSFFFSILSLSLFVDYARGARPGRLLLAGLYLFLAILSKETAATMVGVAGMIFIFFERCHKKRLIAILSVSTAIVLLFMCLWAVVQSRTEIQQPLLSRLFAGLNGTSEPGCSIYAERLYLLGFHVWILLVPYPLSSNYDFSTIANTSIFNWHIILTIAVYALIIATASLRLVKGRRDMVTFGLWFFLITLSIYSNFLFPLSQSYANRYDFFPSVGVCLLLAVGWWKLAGNYFLFSSVVARPSTWILVGIVCVYSVMTFARNLDWKDNITLVNADLQKSGSDYLMQYKAGLELLNKAVGTQDSVEKYNLLRKSINHFTTSIDINAGYTEAHADMGVAFFQLGVYDSAEYSYREVLKINPDHVHANTNLGTLYYRLKRFNDAIMYYQKAVRKDPSIDIAWYNMGLCFGATQQVDSAIACMKRVIVIAPGFDDHKSFGNVAILYEMKGQMDSARRYEQLTRVYFQDFRLRSSTNR